jgi:hypothetical protein
MLLALQVSKNVIWKALMPSIRSCPEGSKYGKKTNFDYSGRYQLHMNFQPSPPYPNVATPAKVLLLPHQKLFVICNFQPLLFTFVAKNNALY